VAMTPTESVRFDRRRIGGDATVATVQTGVPVPHWVKLTRTGNLLTAQHSADGPTWTDVTAPGFDTSDTVMMGGTIYIGLAVSSHAANTACTAVFSNVTITGGITGPWQQAEIGVDHPGNSPQGLYVGLEDSTGKVAFVSHPDPAASTYRAWTEWTILLSSFTGVNPTTIKRLYFGVGDRNGPAPDGAGHLYLDDIRLIRGTPVLPAASAATP